MLPMPHWWPVGWPCSAERHGSGAWRGATSCPPSRRHPPCHPRPQPAPELAALLVDADLEIVVEEGIVRAEVLGLEVARIVHGTTTAGTPIDGPVLEVGVGHADREMTAVVHGGLPPPAQLHRVAEIVGAQRRAGAARHPLNQLAPERWLRSRVVADPTRIGLVSLRSAPPAVPRPTSVTHRWPSASASTRPAATWSWPSPSGCASTSSPPAADARLALAPEASLLLVVPERDAHPVTEALAERLVRPARVVTVPRRLAHLITALSGVRTLTALTGTQAETHRCDAEDAVSGPPDRRRTPTLPDTGLQRVPRRPG